MTNKAKNPTVAELQKQLDEAQKIAATCQQQVDELQTNLAAVTGERDVALAKLRELEASLAAEPTADEVTEIADPVEVRLNPAHPQPSYVRCGIQFTKETLVLSLSDIGEATLQRLNDDVCLDVVVHPADKGEG